VERTCLIVDDEPAIRAYLAAILRREQYLTLEAENAVQAFKLVQKLNGGLNLILSEITMPGNLDGVDLAYAVRNEFQGLADFAFIRKPFTPKAILGAVNRVATSSYRVCPSS
jgi:CheY-like chemotaxis protein